MNETSQRRRIRSFVRRPGRMTEAQRRALETLLPQYCIDESCTDLRQSFERPAALVLEIGFGNGDALLWMAEREAEKNFVGVEVHEPGVGRLLLGLEEQDQANVRVAMRDVVELLTEQTVDASLDEVRIYFPDPWPKKRHHKRRLIQPEFIQLLEQKMRPGGRLHLATDWQPYAEWMLEVLSGSTRLTRTDAPWTERPDWRPQTHFERRGLRKGHSIFDLVYRLNSSG